MQTMLTHTTNHLIADGGAMWFACAQTDTGSKATAAKQARVAIRPVPSGGPTGGVS